jgi:hypothetical protein
LDPAADTPGAGYRGLAQIWLQKSIESRGWSVLRDLFSQKKGGVETPPIVQTA